LSAVTTPAPITPAGLRAPRSQSGLAVAWRYLRANPLAMIGFFVVIFWILVSIFAPLIAPFPPMQQDIPNRLAPPGAPNWAGTDQLGRDVLSRVIYGGRLSLPAGLAVIVIAGAIGTVIGALAGYIGGWFEEIVLRMTEVFMAFPTIILAMAIAAALGPSLVNAVLAMVVVWWPNYARVVRALVLGVKNRDYVEAAQATGAKQGRILWRTVLPNCLGPAVVLATIDLGNAILVFAGLSFLGLGPAPNTPEWGRMIADGIEQFDQWWIAAFPGFAIFTVVMAFNFIGDGIRDALDPRLRKAL
jgi:peptide/nickel transport system permease protein